MAIKFAKYYELTRKDVLMTVCTDSMDMYRSRIQEVKAQNGEYSERNAIRDFHGHLMSTKTDSMIELDHYEKRRIHNLKYYTWVEQQMFDVNELNRQWHDETYWTEAQALAPKIDEMIIQFNEKVGIV
jgi:hypothetical protein